MRKTLPIAFVATSLAFTAAAEKQPYERYQTIVDRQMFGQPPAGFDPTKMPSEVAKTKDADIQKKEEAVKKAIRFSVINVTSAGETVVGFSDNGDPKGALHYYLKVGESQNGWTVKAADPEAATMTIEKEGIEVTLTLGGDSATNQDAVKAVGSAVTAGDRPTLYGAGASSLREKRRQREEAEAKARTEREERRDKVQSELLSELQKLKEEQRQAREEAEAREREAAEEAAKKSAEPEKPSEENVE